jgi:diaminopimelate epimerase
LNDLGLGLEGRFFKAHGHGNDYLVFEEGGFLTLTDRAVQLICHPHRGVGADGIVALLSARGDGLKGEGPGAFRLRMFNPDGSEFERSGNGLRVLGAFLFRTGRVRMTRPFLVEVGGDRVQMEVLERVPGGGLDVAVEMGGARFGMEAVGGSGREGGSSFHLSLPGGETVQVHPVSVGNPHCVVFREDLREEDLLKLGPALTSHEAFPAGANVQLARVSGKREVEILIWERGVGRTASSGTSACAVASACVESGALEPGPIRVIMEGGTFRVGVSSRMEVRLEGPVFPVLTGELTSDFAEALGEIGDREREGDLRS